MKKLSIVLALAGLLLGTVLIGWFGLGSVLDGLRRVGWGDFALIIGWQLVLFAVLGLAWDAITPGPRVAASAGADLGPHGARRVGQPACRSPRWVASCSAPAR